MHLFIFFFGHDNRQGELVCRNKSKGDVDLKELPVRPGTKASMGGGGMDSQEAERSYRCMGKAEFRTTKASSDACSDADGGASLFVPFCQTKVTG